ncbi:HHR130Wp [Eremothecium sinecaudum]|uniref:HHR130Wp n=1 Tax=Eremothecium sinecaudum TaxID=45286 RepID=A0A0X8HWU1_9SACH|nr:HHR130Wp [Eremothecium sinecaudum]AMD22899.1 HHR130Wp [Eremothecium sinecaudum]
MANMLQNSKVLPEYGNYSSSGRNGVSGGDSVIRSEGGTKVVSGNSKTQAVGDDEEFEFYQSFTEDKVRLVIHAITKSLKASRTEEEYIFLPFRPGHSNQKLLVFLNSVFPMGNSQAVGENKLHKIIAKTDTWTLVQALKYIWCRLPGGEVIGWESYEMFRQEEERQGYPAQSFLEIMPKCLRSQDHASIVYDFFDLLIAVSCSPNTKVSAKKISRMCAIWAFGKLQEHGHITNTFKAGVSQWIPGLNATFHLLLSFVRSFYSTKLDSPDTPKALKSLLVNHDYPPVKEELSDQGTMLTVPIVTLKTGTFSRKPIHLIEKCVKLFDQSRPEDFYAREDFVLMKSLFRKKDSIDAISKKMSKESRRLLKEMNTKHSTFQAGWAKRNPLPNTFNKADYLRWGRVDIDDYFIWAWICSLSHEQTPDKRKIFGRSLIIEFEVDGFKKWIILEEADISIDDGMEETTDDNKSGISQPQGNGTPMSEKPQKAAAPFHVREENNISPSPRPPLSYDSNNQQSVNDVGQGINLNKPETSRGHHLQDAMDTQGNLQITESAKKSKWNAISHLCRKSPGGPSDILDRRQTSSVYDECSIIDNTVAVQSLPALPPPDEITPKIPPRCPSRPRGSGQMSPVLPPSPSASQAIVNNDHLKVNAVVGLSPGSSESLPSPLNDNQLAVRPAVVAGRDDDVKRTKSYEPSPVLPSSGPKFPSEQNPTLAALSDDTITVYRPRKSRPMSSSVQENSGATEHVPRPVSNTNNAYPARLSSSSPLSSAYTSSHNDPPQPVPQPVSRIAALAAASSNSGMTFASAVNSSGSTTPTVSDMNSTAGPYPVSSASSVSPHDSMPSTGLVHNVNNATTSTMYPKRQSATANPYYTTHQTGSQPNLTHSMPPPHLRPQSSPQPIQSGNFSDLPPVSNSHPPTRDGVPQVRPGQPHQPPQQHPQQYRQQHMQQHMQQQHMQSRMPIANQPMRSTPAGGVRHDSPMHMQQDYYRDFLPASPMHQNQRQFSPQPQQLPHAQIPPGAMRGGSRAPMPQAPPMHMQTYTADGAYANNWQPKANYPAPGVDLGYAPSVQPTGKLHSGFASRVQGKKRLQHDLRNGAFGI